MINLKLKIQIHTSYLVNLIPGIIMGNFPFIKCKKHYFIQMRMFLMRTMKNKTMKK